MSDARFSEVASIPLRKKQKHSPAPPMNFTSESVPMVFSAFLEYGLWFPNVLWPGSVGIYSSTQGQSPD